MIPSPSRSRSLRLGGGYGWRRLGGRRSGAGRQPPRGKLSPDAHREPNLPVVPDPSTSRSGDRCRRGPEDGVPPGRGLLRDSWPRCSSGFMCSIDPRGRKRSVVPSRLDTHA